MSTPEGIELKIKRAKYHFQNLEGEVRAWLDTGPYGFVRDRDPQTGDRLFRFKMRHPVPLAWSPLIGDVVHNLRSALDHLVCALVLANGKKIGGGTSFPIYETTERYRHKSPGCVQGARKGAIKIIDGLQPYKGGNDALWQLHKLDINDKHRGLIAVTGRFEDLTLGGPPWPPSLIPGGEEPLPKIRFTIAPSGERREPMKDGDIFYRVAAGGLEYDDDPQPAFQPALHEPGLLECEPMMPFLGQLGGTIEKTVKLFDPFFK